MNTPDLTIITVTYNAGPLLQKTLESVVRALPQPERIEYLLIDGASTDNTLAIASEYEEVLKLKIYSESDKGLYDAMNKGLQMAGGRYLWFLNAGDEVHDDQTLTRLFKAMGSAADIYYSDALYISEIGERVGLRSVVTPHALPEKITWRDMKEGMKICHQAFLAKRTIAPLFEIDNLSADLDWEINAMKKATSIEYLDFVLCKYLLGGVSTKQHKKSLIDRWRVLNRHFGWPATALNHLKIAFRGTVFYLKRGKYW